MRSTSCVAVFPRLLFSVLLLMVCSVLDGCIHDVIHQPVVAPPPRAADVAFSTPKLKLDSAATEADRRADNVHATVEFNEQGTLLDDCSRPHPTDRPCQEAFAEAFVRAARQKIAAHDSGVTSLVVIAFMHGNRNNATEDVDNYPHFRELLNCLNLGSQAYKAEYRAPYQWRNASGKQVEYKEPLDCSQVAAPGHVRYIGVYLGWRGRTNKPGINVREGAARKITRGAGVRATLIGLRMAAKDNTTKQPARFIIVGHSFGGLIIERTMMQMYKAAYDVPKPLVVNCNASNGPAQGLPSFTDLVVTINEAVNSIPAKHFIEDVLKPKTGQFCRSDALSPAMQRPILVALESKSDFWSVGYGTYLRHIGGPDDRHPGKFQNTVQYPDGRPSIRKVKLLTPPDNPYFQNLCYLQPGFQPGDPLCNLQTEEKQYAGRDGLVVKPTGNQVVQTRRSAGAPNASALPNDTLNPLDHLYVRRGCRPTNIPVQSGYDPRPVCTGTQYNDDPRQLHVWNDTPYWIGAIDINVINGHSDFWNATFVGLLSGVVNTFPTMTLDQLTQ